MPNAFGAAMKAAKAEYTAVQAKGLKPLRDCDAESDALATYTPLAPWPANK
jgi:hypothetical protein